MSAPRRTQRIHLGHIGMDVKPRRVGRHRACGYCISGATTCIRRAAESQPISTSALPATYTPDPNSLYLPTVTPNPRSTLIVVQTPTPFVLAGGMRPAIIGYSVSGRPIEVYTFGNGEKQRMIVAGIHGGYEWNTIALADELITHIYENPDIIPSDVTLYILRNLNPDGDARDHGYDGRVNDHGVDLNRNFPTNWAADWDRDGCWDYGPTTGGTGPGSEPETRALMGFLQTHKVEALISYHSAALGVFPGGEPGRKTRLNLQKTWQMQPITHFHRWIRAASLQAHSQITPWNAAQFPWIWNYQRIQKQISKGI